MRPLSAALAAAFLLAGCGGGSPPDESTSRTQIEQTVLDVHRHEVSGNGKAACELFTEKTREQVVADNRKLQLGDEPADSCEEAIEKQAHLYASGTIREAMTNVVIDAVEITGERATVTTHSSAHRNGVLTQIPPATLHLAWEDGRWRMA
jgi:hypothetical protein